MILFRSACITVVSAILFAGFGQQAHAKSLVWFGNSYSEGGQIYAVIIRMINCNTCGVQENLTIDSFLPQISPSCWLDCHESKWPAFEVIDNGHFDYVVAQSTSAGWCEQDSIYGSGVAQANQLTTWANHSKGAGGILVLEQMWMPISTSFTQKGQSRSDFWYDSVARATNSLLVPCGRAWWIARQERHNLDYAAADWNDGTHPGYFGAYLNACTFYAALTGVSPVGHMGKSIYKDSSIVINDADALFAQQKAWEAYQYFYPPTNISITNFKANPSASVKNTAYSITFSATVTNDLPIASVMLDLSTLGGPGNVAMTASGNNYSYTYSIPLNTTLGTRTVSLRVTDNQQNYKIERIKFRVESPLAISDIQSAYDNKKVKVIFNEKLEKAFAENIANYSINHGVTISAASLGVDSFAQTVTLTTSALSTNTTYALVANNVKDDAGSIIPSNAQDTFQFFTGGDGLNATYWQNCNLTGTPSLTRVDPSINFWWGGGAPASSMASDWFSMRWDGTINIPYSGNYTFRGHVSQGMRVWINNQLVIDNWGTWDKPGDTLCTGSASLTAGFYPIKVEYFAGGGEAHAMLEWSSNTKISTMQVIPTLFLFSGTATGISQTPEQIHPMVVDKKPEYIIKCISLSGRTLSTIRTSNPKTAIESRTIRASGLYIVEITGGKNSVSRKRVSAWK
jgi:hypothetical protein